MYFCNKQHDHVPANHLPCSACTEATAAAILGHLTYTLPCVEALSTYMCSTPPCLLHSSITSSRTSTSQFMVVSLQTKYKYVQCSIYGKLLTGAVGLVDLKINSSSQILTNLTKMSKVYIIFPVSQKLFLVNCFSI